MDANSALQYGDQAGAALNGVVPNGSAASVASANKNLQGVLNQEDKAMQPALQKFKDISSQPMPQPPTPKTAGPAPEMQQIQQDSQGWISALAVFSSMIGARGRARGTGALKAFAAGMNGIKAGNQQAFEDAHKTWKDNTEAMFKDNEEEMNKYKAVLDNRNLSEAEASQEMKMIGAEYQNKVMASTETAKQAFAVYDSIVKARTGVEAYTAKMDAKAKEQLKLQEQQKADQDKRYDEWKQTPRAALVADAIAKGLPPAYYIRGRGKDGQEQLQFAQDFAEERHPGLDLAEAAQNYNASNAALRSFGNGRQADTVRSFNVAYAHADTLNDLAAALQNGDIQTINAARQRYEQEFGAAAPTNFDAVKSIFSDEVNKAAVGGAGALGDREQIRSSISKASSPEQIKGAVDVYKHLIVGQMQGMKQQYEQATGRKDFDRFLLPEVETDLKNRTGGSDGAPTSDSGWKIEPVGD